MEGAQKVASQNVWKFLYRCVAKTSQSFQRLKMYILPAAHSNMHCFQCEERAKQEMPPQISSFRFLMTSEEQHNFYHNLIETYSKKEALN